MPSLRKFVLFAAFVILSGLIVLLGCTYSSDLKAAYPLPSLPVPTPTPAPNPLTITTTSLAAATAGSAYSDPITASGGTTPYAFSATGLTSGLSISKATGIISGTPAANYPASTTIIVTVTDSSTPTALTASVTFSFIVNPAPVVSSPITGSCKVISQGS